MPGSRDFGRGSTDGGWLSNMSDALKEQSDRRDAERAEFNKRLGEPDFFQPHDQEDPRFGLGYWRIKGGVVSYAKYANGYDPRTRHEYVDSFIKLLTDLQKLKPREGA